MHPRRIPIDAEPISRPSGPSEYRPRSWREKLKRHRVGRVMSLLRRQRRAPARAVRAWRAERHDARLAGPTRTHVRSGAGPGPREQVSAVVCLLAGPGSLQPLIDTVESVRASEPEAGIVVVDDCSWDARESVLVSRIPGVRVVRLPWPTGGAPLLWRHMQAGIRLALDAFDFELFVKMDTDALVVGPRFSATILRHLRSIPNVGMAGSVGVRADGIPEDVAYHAWVLRREIRRDAVLARAVQAASRRPTFRLGETVQGGSFCLTSRACHELQRQGWLSWRQPWMSFVDEDTALSLFTQAMGLEIASLSGSDHLFAIGNFSLPIATQELADGPWVLAHSVRRGLEGESEADLRRFFADRRRAWLEA